MLGDRTFSLQKVHNDGTKKAYETLLVGYVLELSLFGVRIEFDGRNENHETGDVIVSWNRPAEKVVDEKLGPGPIEDEIRFPLKPSTNGLSQIDIDLHGSRTTAFDMGDHTSRWFSERLGYEVRLAYMGESSRPVLGSLAPHSRDALAKAGWMNRLKAMLPFSLFTYPAERLVFNDIAHYLVVTEESNEYVTSILEDGCEMDITKFRPNIVVKGAPGPFVEDFWGELSFDSGVQMPLTGNCYRCQSITVDFNTGKTATDDRGSVWKKLNKTRRVDKGAKWSPIFGRYGYCFGSSVGKSITVGQKAYVTRVNSQRTFFGKSKSMG